MSIEKQKWSIRFNCKTASPLLMLVSQLQLCTLSLNHHQKVEADNHYNDLFFTYSIALGQRPPQPGEYHIKPQHTSQAKQYFKCIQLDFQGSVHLQIITSCKTFTLSTSRCKESAVLLRLFPPALTANLSTPRPGWVQQWVLNTSQSFCISGSNLSLGA